MLDDSHAAVQVRIWQGLLERCGVVRARRRPWRSWPVIVGVLLFGLLLLGWWHDVH